MPLLTQTMRRLCQMYYCFQGGKSPKSTKEMLEELNHTIADSTLETFPQLDHFGPENENEPNAMAQVLKNFFLNS